MCRGCRYDVSHDVQGMLDTSQRAGVVPDLVSGSAPGVFKFFKCTAIVPRNREQKKKKKKR